MGPNPVEASVPRGRGILEPTLALLSGEPERRGRRLLTILPVPVAALAIEALPSVRGSVAPHTLLLLAVAASAFAGGLRAGLVGGVLVMLYAPLRLGSAAGADAVVWPLATLLALTPIVALVTGWSRDRERRLRDARRELALFQQIFRNANDGIAIIDPDGRYIAQNAAHSELTGYTDDELAGHTPALHFGGDAFATIAQSLAEQGSYRGEVAGQSKDGSRHMVEVSAFAVRDDSGRVACYVGAKRDVTERRRTQAELRRRFTEENVLHRMVAALGRVSGAEEIYEEAIKGMREAVRADRVAILLFDLDGVMRFRDWHGLSDEYRRAVEGHSPWQINALHPEPWLIPDIEAEPRIAHLRDDIRREGIAALAFLPLLTNGRLIGKFMLYFDQPHVFTEDEVRMSQTVSAQIAFAIRRQWAEAAVARQEREYRTLADNAPDIIARFDRDLRHVYVNHAAERATGLTVEEMLGRTHEEIGLPIQESRIIDDAIRHVFETDCEYELEFTLPGPSGPQYYHCRLVPESSPDEAVRTVLAIARDLSDRRRLEQLQRLLGEASALLVSSLEPEVMLERIARLVAEELGDGCAIHVLSQNGELERSAYVTEDPVHAERVREFERLYPTTLESTTAHAVAFRTGESQLYPEITDEQLQGAAVDARHLELLRGLGLHSLMAVPLVARGRTLGVMTMLSHTLGHRFTAADLEVAEELARRVALAVDNARLFRESEEANRAKAQFLAVMSHELRTPLNAIIGYTDLLTAGVFGEVPQNQAARLERVRVSAYHLLSVIEQILTFSRPQAQIRPLHVETVDAVELARSAATMVEPSASDKGLELRLAALDRSVLLQTDGGKLRQILVNLLGNAVKFTDQGFVELGVGRIGGLVRFTVRDTGIGIDDPYLDRVFDPFWQADQSATRRAGGTGLGLTVSRNLAQLLGGDVRVDSVSGEGSTFTLDLPFEGHIGSEVAGRTVSVD